MNTFTPSSKVVIILLVLGALLFGMYLSYHSFFPVVAESVRESSQHTATTTEENDILATSTEVSSLSSSPSLSTPATFPVEHPPLSLQWTKDVPHTVPLSEIIVAGPFENGVPAIDEPRFISASDAGQYLEDGDEGVGIIAGSDIRFYPLNILAWNEVVNDTVNYQPMTVVYSPLCRMTAAFGGTVVGRTTLFSASGRVWKSHTLIRNKTNVPEEETLYSTLVGEGVIGPNAGGMLASFPSDIVPFGQWKKIHPTTKVLSKNTGIEGYGYQFDPYEDYYTAPWVSFGATSTDERLQAKEFVYGLLIEGKAAAVHTSLVPQGTNHYTLLGKDIRFEKSDLGEVRAYYGGSQMPVALRTALWFCWASAFPESMLLK